MKQHTRFSTSLTTREGTESEIYVSDPTRTVFHLLSYRLLQGSEAMLQGDATSPLLSVRREDNCDEASFTYFGRIYDTHYWAHERKSTLCFSLLN
jgi:hypothetical protein